MKYVIVRVDSEGLKTFYNGSVFTENQSLSYLCSTVEEARRIQGMLQSQDTAAEISKQSVTVKLEGLG
jgi:hypothetical protein